MMEGQQVAPPRREEHSRPADIQALVPLLELRNRLGAVYGSEELAPLFYSLVRRERPVNMVELGTGLGVTAFWMAQAARENGAGRVWTIDDGSHWQEPAKLRAALGPLLEAAPFDCLDPETLTYPQLIRNLTDLLGLGERLTFLNKRIDYARQDEFSAQNYGFLAEPIDFLFLDIARTPDDILDTLVTFLPHMAESASIFIDSASTSVVGYLFLEQLIDQLRHGKVPRRFLLGQSAERRRALTDLVAQRRFTMMHLIERLQRAQNSTAWIRIEPNDYMPHPQTLMKWV
ncbi:MAG: class I SAM-dependent methyltransferase [Kiloniellales bacterium]